MYSLQKPDFEAVLLAELQRQQQCDQFCDVLLKAKDTFVPMHSCILSAFSPSIFSTLCSTPSPPAGQRRLLEFPTLDARTLFHLVRLFYTGRMTGVLENEKQEVISAVAKLGIHGLVEVTEIDSGGQAELCRKKEAGVQTETQRREEDEWRQVRWRREVVEGNTCLWKEKLSCPGKEVWTQTEEANTAPLALPLASFDTVEVGAFQNLAQADYHHCVPVAVLCPPKNNQTHQLSSSTLPAVAKEPSHLTELVPTRNDPPVLTHFSHQMVSGTTEPQRSGTGPQGAGRGVMEAAEPEEENFEYFQDNIPGFINYFMNQNKKEDGGHGRRGRRGQRGANTAGPRQERTRRPRRRPRGQRTSTQLVDMQNVKTSKLPKVFLHRWAVKTPRTGQGGGRVGKKLCLKTRDGLTPTRRKRECSQAWEPSPIKNVQPRIMGRERKSLGQHHQESRQGNQTQVCSKKSSSVSSSSSTSSSLTGPLQTSSAHISPPPAASRMTAASPILHTTPLPPLEEQPEQIERLLEEVMMGLHILPNNNNIPAQQQCPLPTSSSNTFDSSRTLSKQQDPPPAGSEVPVLQQQFEGELNEILDHFLQSFEQHMESCCVREAHDASNASSSDDRQPCTIQSRQTRSSSDPEQQEPRQVGCVQAAINGDQQPEPPEVPAAVEIFSERAKKTSKKKKTCCMQKTKTQPCSLEKKVPKRRKKKSSSNAEAKSVNERADNLQQQITTKKKLVKPQEHRCHSLENKAQNEVPSVKYLGDHSSKGLKVYPIRSRIKREFPEDLPPTEEAPPAVEGHKSRRPTKKAQPLILSNEEHIEETVGSYSDNQAEKHHEEREEDLTVLPCKVLKEPAARGKKREAASEETSDTSTMTKRPSFDQTTQPTLETFSEASGAEDLSSTEQDDIIDVETVSLSLESDYLQDTKLKVEGELKQVISKELNSSDNEIIDVEGDQEEHGSLWGLGQGAGEEVKRMWETGSLSPPVKKFCLE